MTVLHCQDMFRDDDLKRGQSKLVGGDVWTLLDNRYVMCKDGHEREYIARHLGPSSYTASCVRHIYREQKEIDIMRSSCFHQHGTEAVKTECPRQGPSYNRIAGPFIIIFSLSKPQTPNRIYYTS